MKIQSRFILPATLLFLLLLAATLATALAEGMNGTMRIDRDLKTGANECYRTVTYVQAGAEIMLLGRNEDGSWVFVWSDAGDGWAPASSVNPDGAIDSLAVWNDHFIGETCNTTPPPSIDARICGRPGNVTTATTVRWTDIFSTADPDLTTGRSYPPQTALTLTGRDFWGCFVRVRSNTTSGNGWIPVQAIDTREIMGLAVIVDNSGGCQINGNEISNCDNDDVSTQGDIRTVHSATTIYNEPNTNVSTNRTVPANGRVRIISEREDGWVRIRSRYGNGYIQASQLNPASAADSQGTMLTGSNLYSEPDTDGEVFGFVPQGTQVTILGFAAGAWIRIETPQGTGWVPQATVSRR